MLVKTNVRKFVQDMETIMREAAKIARVKKLVKKRSQLMKKVNLLDQKIGGLLESRGRKAKGSSAGKLPAPKPGSGPFKLCKVMSSRPMMRKEIAKKTGLTEGTIKFYLRKYACFKLAGWGKGYIYEKPKGQ
ncbi:MAG: hypothetical protein GX455_16950 [Phycisphaerae bacterium]|nr:hypothetical protein [Phycisphaerae bacterium]